MFSLRFTLIRSFPVCSFLDSVSKSVHPCIGTCSAGNKCGGTAAVERCDVRRSSAADGGELRCGVLRQVARLSRGVFSLHGGVVRRDFLAL